MQRLKLHKFIKRYTSITCAIDMLRRKELTLLDPQNWDDRNDRYFMALYKEHLKRESMYAVCFTQSKETYHHWRVFTGGDSGACIEIHKPAFVEMLNGTPGFRKGPVTYLQMEDILEMGPKDVGNLPFLKRWGYGPEEEYRVMTTSDEPQAAVSGLSIDLAIINRIYLNPWIPENVYESVKATIKGIPGCGHIKVTKSRLINFQRWKDAGDHIAGKPKPTRPVFTPKKKPGSKFKPKPAPKSTTKATKKLPLKRPTTKKK